MMDLDNLPKHPIIEQMVEELVVRCNNNSPEYFRVIATYFVGMVASSMRAIVSSEDMDDIPVNVFATAFGPSGFGKTKALHYFERDVLSGFLRRFKTDTLPTVADNSLWNMAIDKAASTGNPEDDEKAKLDKLYVKQGAYMPAMRSASTASIQQMRGKLLMASIGSMQLQIDEIGNNIGKQGVLEALEAFLELYDMGLMGTGATKNTDENIRLDSMEGITPSNMLMFGVPSKLFDGGQSEQLFMQLQESGMPRRNLHAWGIEDKTNNTLDPEERYRRRVANKQVSKASGLKSHFFNLADPSRHGWTMEVSELVGMKKTAYEILCEERANNFSSQDDIRRTEMINRPFKAIKVAGALAFVDESLEVTMDHLLAAIGIVEESGVAFEQMLNQDQPHVRLAKHLLTCGNDQTLADFEMLPYYKSASVANKKQMIETAQAWCHKNNGVIKKRYEDDIIIYSGDALEETDLDNMILSYSGDVHGAHNYVTEPVPFDKLEILALAPSQNAKDTGMHWVNHRLSNGHRAEDDVIPGFNMLVVDVDGGTTLDFVHDALKDHTFLTYTTKRHQENDQRFRLLMPISYILEMGKEEYSEFIDNFLMWLPFDSDQTARQRSKKWLTNDQAQVYTNEGKLLDPLPWIPRTKKNEDYHKRMGALGSLGNLERWFAQRIQHGDRNNQMIKYALALVDSGMGYLEVENAVLRFNSSLSNSMTESELRSTVLQTIAKKTAAAA